MKMSRLAPIALFVYKRPEHTRKTLESLMACPEFAESPTYIFCDGPKNHADGLAVQATRRVIHSYNLPNATIIKKTENQGLANSIIGGVTEVCNKHDRIIVVEDDLLVSPFFLDYMNNALTVYAQNKQVMHISGYMFPVKENLPETFFYRAASCWGWGTWKRAWDLFEPDSSRLLTQLHLQQEKWDFDIQGSMAFFDMLQSQAKGKLDSWAIRWYASVFLNNGLCLHPAKALVNNIGHDGTGEHCGVTMVYTAKMADKKISYFESKLEESPLALKAMAEFFRSLRRPLHIRVFNKLKRVIKSVIK